MENDSVISRLLNSTFDNNSTKEESQSAVFACKNYDLVMRLVVKFFLVSLGCVGNTLTTLVMWPDKQKSATAFLLIMLAIADTSMLFVWFFLVALPGE